jgi:hypothetical protein
MKITAGMDAEECSNNFIHMRQQFLGLRVPSVARPRHCDAARGYEMLSEVSPTEKYVQSG